MGNEDMEKNEDDKDTELDLLAQQELLRLTRQFRVRQFCDFKTVMLLLHGSQNQIYWRATVQRKNAPRAAVY
jgi:hypothetical protein